MPIPQPLSAYAAKLGFQGSETLGRIFSILYDDPESLAVAAALPGDIPSVAAKTGLSEQAVKEILDRLVRKGAVSRLVHKKTYSLYSAMIELRDTTVISPDCPQELFELWDVLIRQEMPALVPILKSLNLPPMLRVIPIEESVESSSRVINADSARNIIEAASLITAIPCPCRTQAKRVGTTPSGCPAPEGINLCMQINGFAEAVVDRGVGERLTREEALRRLDLAEQAGLVHTVRNNIKDDMFMCNCCSCCCTAMFLHNRIGYASSFAPSRFRAHGDADLCTGCGVCEEKCAFQAITVDDIVRIDEEKCFGCGNCVKACPFDALTLKEVRPPEFIRRT
jgi:ferredoxin